MVNDFAEMPSPGKQYYIAVQRYFSYHIWEEKFLSMLFPVILSCLFSIKAICGVD